MTEEEAKEVREAMLPLVIASLKTAAALVARGHDRFWCFALVLRPDGCMQCVVAHEDDFVPVLSSQPQTHEQLAPNIISLGPSMTTECLAANKDPFEEPQWGYNAVVERLVEMAEAKEIVGSAIVLNGLDGVRDEPQQRIEVELEHQSGWVLLWSEPYTVENGKYVGGEVAQYDTDRVVWPEYDDDEEEEEDDEQPSP